MIRINNIKVYEDLDEEHLINFISNKYNILKQDIIDWHISKKSIDARKKDNVHYNYSIDLNFKNENKYKTIFNRLLNCINYNINRSNNF